MVGIMIFAIIVVALAAFGAAAIRFGVDSRTMTADGRPMSLFAR
jgi:hypothetical protein